MSDTKYTPGPWQIKKGHIGDKVTFFVSPNGVYDGIHIHWGEKRYGIPTQESEANAKLIAAAPDLLEALQSAKELISNYRLKKEVPTQGTWDEIEAAIKKATT